MGRYRVFWAVLVLLAVSLPAQDRSPYWKRWNAASKAGNWTAAVRAMREGLALFPGNPDFASCLAWGLRNLKRPGEAVALLEPLLAASPAEKKLREALAYALLDIGWKQFQRKAYAAALVPFSRAHSLLPDDRYVLNAYGCGLREVRRIDEAILVLEKGYRKWPADPYLRPNLLEALVIKANILTAASNHGEAERFFRRAAALDRQNESYLLHYGIFLNGRRRFREALAVFAECARRYPANPWVRGNVQFALQETARQSAASGDTAGALRQAEAALVRYPREVWFLHDCLLWSIALRRLGEAERWLLALSSGPLLQYGKPWTGNRRDLVRYRMGDILWRHSVAGRHARGFALLARMGAAFPGALFVEEAQGNFTYHSGRQAEGISIVNRVYDRYIQGHPQFARPLLLDLPLRGIMAVWGNNRTDAITHAGMNRFCFDFLGADDSMGFRRPGSANPGRNTDYYGFGRAVLSAADGVVELVEDSRPDIAPRLNPVLGDGNSVIVRDARGFHYCYVHNRRGSAVVRVGQRVRAGQKLAELGNSGYTAIPHLHFGVYSPDWRVSIPVRFRDYRLKKGARWIPVAGGVPGTGELINW